MPTTLKTVKMPKERESRTRKLESSANLENANFENAKMLRETVRIVHAPLLHAN